LKGICHSDECKQFYFTIILIIYLWKKESSSVCTSCFNTVQYCQSINNLFSGFTRSHNCNWL